MVNNKNIKFFINYNFTPFRKLQCIKRALFMWILNIPFYILGKSNIYFGVMFSIINFLVSVGFIVMMIKSANAKSSRFICDGITCFCVSFALVIYSYIALTYVIGANLLLLGLLLCIFFAFIVLFIKLIYKNITKDRYSTQQDNKKVSLLPFIGAISAGLMARLFLNDITNNIALVLLSMCLLFLAFVTSIGSVNLLKVYLMKKTEGRLA